MSKLSEQVIIKAGYTRSINLQRDVENQELVESYLPTAKSIQVLRQVASGLGQESVGRASALIGPFGSGKSAFALFLSALMAAADDPLHQSAIKILELYEQDEELISKFTQSESGDRGFLRVVVNGIPASLTRQLLSAFLHEMEQQSLSRKLCKKIRTLVALTVLPKMDQVIELIEEVQAEWSEAGGKGILLEIDELGKFLEYEAYHPQNREIHLLQLLAEHAQKGHIAPLHVIVMLHQSFEHYTQRLGKHLRDEWQKIQGRFSALAFIEPAEQSLRILSAAFDSRSVLSDEIKEQIQECVGVLVNEGALPHGLTPKSAQALFTQCYPLHPLTTLILPVLCQKVAQNERTLFSYLGSQEPFGLRFRLKQLEMGGWVMPAELYDYFMLNHSGGFSDPLTYHRWVEVATALERFDAEAGDPSIALLKTVGLMNLLGGQRGLKSSEPILQLMSFGPENFKKQSQRLIDASIIHFRRYSQEFRVWQGTDFDLTKSLQQGINDLSSLSLADKLNTLAPFSPIVARKATIKTGTLRSFAPVFASLSTRPKVNPDSDLPRIIFYLSEEGENSPDPSEFGESDVLAICVSTERLREAVITQLALQELPKYHAVLQQDPVAQREHRDWLHNANIETSRLLRTLLEEPESLTWSVQGEEWVVSNRRGLQEKLSSWMKSYYSDAPLIRNELSNWDKPSPSANTGRKRLINAMLSFAEEEDLDIEKTPAEKGLYLSLLKSTGLHRRENDRLGFYDPPIDDPCNLLPMWNAITEVLGSAGDRQVLMTEIYQVLRSKPFGIKLGILPIIITAYYLSHQREVALYQEGIFSDEMTHAKAELLCRRPELFALERFELVGLQGNLFDQYLGTIVGKVREDATLLDIVGPLVRFFSKLPPYTMRCSGLSVNAERVRKVISQSKSPGVLLFQALPKACGVDPAVFTSDQPEAVEAFIKSLVLVLRELNTTYSNLLGHWQQKLNHVLLRAEITDLTELRNSIKNEYKGLDSYAPDQKNIGAFIRRLCDEGYDTDEAWLESIATFISGIQPQKWTDENRLNAELKLEERGKQVNDLKRLGFEIQNGEGGQDAMLIRWIDRAHGEVSKVVRMSPSERDSVKLQVSEIEKGLIDLDEDQQLVIIAELLGRLSNKQKAGELG